MCCWQMESSLSELCKCWYPCSGLLPASPLTPALLVPVQIVLFCVGAAQAMAVTLLPACAALTPWWQGQSFSLPVMGLVSVHAGGRPLAAACVCPCQHTSKLS